MAEEERAGEGAVLLVLRRRPRGARAPKSLQFRSGGADKGTRDMNLGRGRGEGRTRGDERGARMLGSPAGLPS